MHVPAGRFENVSHYLISIDDVSILDQQPGHGIRLQREVTAAINYLDGRADFWQRYKPISARVGEGKGADQKKATGEELALQVEGLLW
jgi:hypothetical protein